MFAVTKKEKMFMKRVSQTNILAKDCMVTALMQLVEKKPFSSISISEITERAGVSRMTYYRNYASKEEIFEKHMEEIVEAYKCDIRKIGNQENYASHQNILHCFKYFDCYKGFISCILKVGMGNLLLEALSKYMVETYCTDEKDVKLSYQLQAYAGALFNVYVAWLKNNTKESVEEMADIFCADC